MKYFGPHENSVIDFRELEEAPIFLIGGDTGAGKSTIFDAMTFALFGSTTGDRNAKELRSQFAPDDQKTEVVFYFEQGNQLYRINRTPEQFLAKKRGTGLAKKSATAKLAIVDQVNGTEISSVASKPVDVGHEVDSILNLTADQFKKIILLPQNDFSEFLKSDTTEKEPILKKIFGTQLFSEFTDKLKAKYDEAKKHSEGFENQLQMQLDSNTWTDDEKEQLAKEANEQKVVLLKGFVTERSQKLNNLNHQKDSLSKAVEQANKNLQQAKDIDKKFTDLQKYQTNYQAEITNKQDQFAANQAHLQQLQWAKPLQESVRDLQTKQTEYQANQQSKIELSQIVEQAKTAHQANKSRLGQLNKQKVTFDQNNQRIKELDQLIPTVKNIEELQQRIKQLKPHLTELQENFNQQNDSAKQLTELITNKKAGLPETAELQTQRNQATAEKEQFINQLTPLENSVNNLNSEIAKTKQTLEQQQATLTSDQAKSETIKAEYDKQISRRQDLMIAQLQKELVDGAPCVVCGSTDHSHMIHKIDADENELKKAMEQVDQAQNDFASIEKIVETDQNNLKNTQADLTKLQDSLTEANNDLQQEYAKLAENSSFTFEKTFSMDNIRSVFDAAIEKIDAQLQQAQKLATEIAELQTQLDQANQKANQINLDLTSQKANLESAQADLAQKSQNINLTNNSAELTTKKSQLEAQITKYQQSLETSQKAVQASQLTLSNNQTKLDDTNERLEKEQAAIAQLQDQIDSTLTTDAPTQDKEVLHSWISEIAHDEISNLQVAISNYQTEKQRLEKEIKQVQQELEQVQRPDLEHLQEILDEQNRQKDQIIKDSSYATKVVEDAQASLKHVNDIMKKQGSFAKKFGEITSLYNIVTGKDGNDSKLKLETYVVQNYLQRVLTYANDHFINLLSNNRYTFELSNEASDKRKDHGLDINVFDNETGDSRSSKTLSGGETFIAALSIALSLSEVVQSSSNGVQIDALFVDEGFGSLDHETLDKAMTALETIGENRMVGVISHIDSMKNTIGQQVHIKKLGDGRSIVQMISK